MKDNKLIDLSINLSVKVVKFCEDIKEHFSLVNESERSTASIGANIHEVNIIRLRKTNRR